MKKVLLLLILSSCTVSVPIKEKTDTVCVQNCVTQKWDTMTITYIEPLEIRTSHQAVPILVDGDNHKKAINVCDFKILNK